MENINTEYERLCDEIDDLYEDEDSVEFKNCLKELEVCAENGSIEASEFLAEILAYDGANHNAERAYKWYFVALSAQGYTTEFKDKNGTPPHYCGSVGDFRNESMVSGLVSELGFDKIQELDTKIKKWLIESST